MTVYRRIFKVTTLGSRLTGNLRPAFTDDFGRNYHGVNFSVLEYEESAGTCVLEVWCSDHPAQPDGGTPETVLDKVAQHPAVLSLVQSHPKSPPILGGVATTAPDSVDEAKMTVTVKGNTGTYLRKEMIQTPQGPVARYVLDEG